MIQSSADPKIVVVIGASAGGVDALMRVVSSLPADFEAPVCVVLHVSPTSTSALPAILDRNSALSVSTATDGERLRNGHVYVAPPDQHLTIDDGHIRMTRGPRLNGVRPSVDALFRSASKAKGASVLGVILSGSLDDGASGMAEIMHAGGQGIVQNPEHAFASGMPSSAAPHVSPDHIVELDEVGPCITALVHEMRHHPRVSSVASTPAEPGAEVIPVVEHSPVPYSCPECNGSLWRMSVGPLEQYRCRVGHMFSETTLFHNQEHALEAALWTAIRALEERADLARRLARRMKTSGNDRAVTRYLNEAEAAERQVTLLRSTFFTADPGTGSQHDYQEA